MKRRILSAVTAVLLLVSLLPAAALAADVPTAVPEDRMEIYTIQGVTGEITDGRAVYTVESKENTSDWTQNSGEGSDQTYTYVGLYITMPESAVSLKYSDEGNREEMTQVPAGSDFLQEGRFQHWFPVAYETEDGGFGLFYGGRTYTLLLDWYNEANECILQEQVTAVRNLDSSLAVAQVGNYTYETLADAVAAARSGDTITLLADCSAEDIVIDKGITLDLNGKTVTAAGGSGKDAFYVMLGGDLNLTGSGAIAATGQTRAFDVVGNTAAATWDTTTGRAVLTVGSDVTVTTENELCIWIGGKGAAVNLYGSLTAGQKNPVVQGNGTNNATTNNGGTEINIYPGAELTSASVAMYLPQSGTTNISGGTVEGYAAIGIKSGTLNITGGTVKGTKDDTVLGDEHSATNGIAYDGSAIVIDSYIGYAGKMNLNISGDAVIQSAYSTVIREIGNNTGATNVVSIDISGGTLTGGTGMDCVKVRDVTAKTVSITGGTFTSNVGQFVPTGYKCADNENGTYTVSIIDDQLVVEGETETGADGTTVSGTLGGVFNTGTDIADNVDGGTNDSETGVEDNAITVDLTTAEDTPAAAVTTLTVQAQTAATLDGADSLTIVSDAGTVELPSQAMDKISAAGDAGSPVTIKVVQDAASYSVSVTDASGANLLPGSADDNGTITISVSYTLAADKTGVLVFCVDAGSHGRMASKLENGTLTWTTSHLSTFQGVEYDGDDEVIYITNSSAAAGSLADALNAVKNNGGTIYLLKDVELQDASYWITGEVAVKSAGVSQTTPVIHATVPASSKCFTVYHPGALTLEDIQLVIEKEQDATATYGIDVYHGATLTLNNAAVELKNLSNATISSDDTKGQLDPGVFQLNGSTITATDIGGNFSNGGDWELTNNSEITITGCTSHGLSCDSLAVDNSKLKVTGTGLLGVTAREINLTNGAQITVDGCGTELPEESKWSTDKESYKYPVEIKKGGSVSVDATSAITLQNNKSGEEDNNVLYLVESQLDNQGMITADVKSKAPENSYVVTLVDRDVIIKSDFSSGSYTLPVAPSREGYTFTGWSDGEKVYQPNEVATIEKDTTFTAQWQANAIGGGGGGVATYGVNVADAANGTVTVNPKLASQATQVTVTVKPDAGYELSSLTVTGTNGEVAVTKVSDTQYTFKMPGCAVTVTAVFQLQGEGGEENVLPFTDVAESAWYYDAVVFVYNEGMMNGTGGTYFEPATNLSRAMIAQVLFNLENAPAGTLGAFEDVVSGSWYCDAVNWAAAQSIVTGYGDGTFGPEEDITREQMAAILYRYAQYKEYISVEKGDLSAFTDGDTVSDWARTAMEWAVGNGVLSGKGNGLLDPTGTASRAEVAQILMNFCNAFVK